MNNEITHIQTKFRITFCTLCAILLSLGSQGFSYETPSVIVFIFWLVLLNITSFVYWLLKQYFASSFKPFKNKPATQTLLAFFIISIPVVLMTIAVEMDTPRTDAPQNWKVEPLTFIIWFADEWFDQLAAFLIPTIGLDYLLKSYKRENIENELPKEVKEALKPELEKLLNRIQFNDIAIITADEHYIRVWDTSGNQEHIKYTFTKALKDLSALNGHQVHRSWWVSQTVIKELNKENRKYILKTNIQQDVPVSDRYLQSVIKHLA